MENVASVVSSVSILVIALIYLIRSIKESREYNKKKILDYAVTLIEEGISYSEEKNKYLKRETAINAGKSLQKQPVEVTKDQVAIDKFMFAAMQPIREIAHNNAKEYILESVRKLSDKKLRNGVERVFTDTLDSAIKMRICGAKMAIAESIRPLLYRSL